MDTSILDFSEVAFPIVALSVNTGLSFHRNTDDILHCSKYSLKKGAYNDLRIIDSNGKLYRVIKAEKIGTVGSFWGYDIFLDQALCVQLIARSTPEEISLADLKNEISNAMNSDKDIWNATGTLSRDLRSIQKAVSHDELLRKQTENFYHEYL